MAGGFNTSIEFDLTFVSARETRSCRQVWRRDNRLGVAFR